MRSKAYLWSFFAFLLVSFAIAMFVPADARIGNWVKVIYFHASIARNSVYFFVLAGFISLIAFFRKDFLKWALSFETTAILFWIIQTFLGFFIMKEVWGGFLWREPKVMVAVVVFFFSLLVILAVDVTRSAILFQISSMVIGGGIVYLLFAAKNVFHPDNPILASPSALMKILFEIITIFTFLAFFSLSAWFREGNKGLKVQSKV